MLDLTRPNSPAYSDGSRRQAKLDFLWLEVTGKCNLRCLHCYADAGPERRLHEAMAPADWENVLTEAAELGCRAVQFIGGEPTMYPALPALIERARTLGFETIEVYTNGTVFKPKVKAALLRHKVDLAFSMYADNAESHDRATQQTGSFGRTLDSIRWAIAAGLSVRIGIIELEGPEPARAAEAMLRGIGVTRIGIDRIRGVGRGQAKPGEAQFGELCGHCAAGSLAVTASGEIFPCVFSRFWPVGHARDGLRAAIEGPSLGTFERSLQVELDARSVRDGTHRPLIAAGEDPCRPRCDPKLPPGSKPKPDDAGKPNCGPLSGPPNVCQPNGPPRKCAPQCHPANVAKPHGSEARDGSQACA